MRVCIFEDSTYVNFLPIAYFRPVFDLRCGAMSLLEKITAKFPAASVSLQVRETLAECCRDDHPDYLVNTQFRDSTLFINARLLINDTFLKTVKKKLSGAKVFLADNEIAAVFMNTADLQSAQNMFVNGVLNEQSLKNILSEEISCVMARYPWDLVHKNADEIENDVHVISKKSKKRIAGKIYPGASLLNRKNILIGKGSSVKPGVVLDAEHGSIIIGKNVIIMPNAVITGPAFIGDGSMIKVGAKIYHGTSIGGRCKVGGEVEGSIIQSFSNKQHDGFLGHSYLGSWVNLGADTNTSDLKNTYGNVRVELNSQQIDTGYQFVGLTMGDHSKTGINVMFDTGTIAGVSCNIFGADLPRKNIPSFSWGQKNAMTTYDIEKGIETARRVMARRDVVLSPAYEKLMRSVFAATEADRKKGGVS